MTKPNRRIFEKIGIVKRSDSRSQAETKMSLMEAGGRAALTATVTFVVGWILKRMFENSVKEASPQLKVKPSSATNHQPASYRSAPRRAAVDRDQQRSGEGGEL